MGIQSLAKFISQATPGALQSAGPNADGGSAGVPPFDCVYLDLNSLLFDGDIGRVLHVLRLLRPRVALIAAADEVTDRAADRKRMVKCAAACRYLAASAELVRALGTAGREPADADAPPRKRRRRSDVMSPLALPQASPPAALADIALRTSPECVFATVDRAVPGPADCKVSRALRLLSWRAPCGRHCIVSKDNDMLLAAAAAWRSRKGRGAPAHVLTWDRWEDGTTLVDLGAALQPLLAPRAPLAPPAAQRLGLDFAVLALLTLGGDLCPSLVGRGSYTALGALCKRHSELFPGVPEGRGIVLAGDGGPPVISPDALLVLLRRSGVGRAGRQDEEGAEDAASGARDARRWCRALWASVAMVAAGRIPGEKEAYPQRPPPSTAAVTAWIAADPEKAAEALGGGEAGAAADDGPLTVEVFAATPDAAQLAGQGQALEDGELPGRNPLSAASLPPLPVGTTLWRARVPLGDALKGRARHLRDAPSDPAEVPAPVRLSPPSGVAPAPMLFRGFVRAGLAAGRKRARPPQPLQQQPAAAPAPAAGQSIHDRLWAQMMGGSSLAPQPAAERDADALAAIAAQRSKRTQTARARRERTRKQRQEEANRKREREAEAGRRQQQEHKRSKSRKARVITRRKLNRKKPDGQKVRPKKRRAED
eukprot:TRINITY_DN8588_c0_g6_i2.p1 TRINITY_DN8588_c0_g6~~TRINITY_DN8588_c0_g6_i2.p1  ORF type:complete len:683 (+),score=202.67 TRINITY_DN8588_c0_g6_i2:91-2049(+)